MPAAAKPAKKTAPRKTAKPAKHAGEQVVDRRSESDRIWAEGPETAVSGMRAEVAMEDVPDGAIAVPIGGEGHVIHILDPRDWASSANSCLQTGDFESWAEECLAPGEYDQIWRNLRDGRGPTIGQVQDMFEVWHRLTGNDAGKLPTSPASLRRMARR